MSNEDKRRTRVNGVIETEKLSENIQPRMPRLTDRNGIDVEGKTPKPKIKEGERTKRIKRTIESTIVRRITSMIVGGVFKLLKGFVK